MRRMLFMICLTTLIQVHAQNILETTKPSQRLQNQKWDAQWISPVNVDLNEYGVYHYKKTFNLNKKEEFFVVNVSADNRYVLYVNGNIVGDGPVRSDPAHWYFDTIDIAQHLVVGKNVITAKVWNFGEYKPHAQMSVRTSFILQGNSQKSTIVNSNDSWRIYVNKGYSPNRYGVQRTVTGPGDFVDYEQYPKSLDLADNSHLKWDIPKIIGYGIPYGKSATWGWMLNPRPIPFMERVEQQFKKVVNFGYVKIDTNFLTNNKIIDIPKNSKLRFVFDQSVMTIAHPKLKFNKGKGSRIELKYAESLVDSNGNKGHRNNINGKIFNTDFSDLILPDGEIRTFIPLELRTFRFVEMTIETADEPLQLIDFSSTFSAYPFKEIAYFKTNNQQYSEIWDVGWRTLRLCAGESFMDCPYYEQLQYIGDTKIQSLVSLYISGDSLLTKKALGQFYNSIIPDGLTQSRYPSKQAQIIPPFSLIYVSMVHDYWMLRNDEDVEKVYLPAIDRILTWFRLRIDDSGILGPLEWWNFVDWSFGPWSPHTPIGGTPKAALEGGSSILTLQYILALQQTSDMLGYYGYLEKSKQYEDEANQLISSLKFLCFDNKLKLLADDPSKIDFSVHANALGVLAGMFDQKESEEVMIESLNNTQLTTASLYFQFYVNEALFKSGMGNKFLGELEPWKKSLALGLTTFPETPEPTRSDCHAWSSSPNYHFLSIVCGIRPNKPGFNEVLISPNLGNLDSIDAIMPHPNGLIKVKIDRNNNNLDVEIELPESIPGVFKWEGKDYKLRPGSQKINI